MKRSSFSTAILALGLATLAVTATGQPAGAAGPPPGYDARPGMMGSPGGPGMMGGHGGGPGMMGGHGGGPGMMGGYGPGMMGGYGGGLGSDGFAGVVSRLGLTTDQQQKIARIHEDTRQRNWEAMGQLLSEQFTLRNLFLADKMDANAIVEQQRKVDEIRRGLIKSHIEMEIQIEALLTKVQRDQLRSAMPWQMH